MTILNEFETSLAKWVSRPVSFNVFENVATTAGWYHLTSHSQLNTTEVNPVSILKIHSLTRTT